MPTAVIWKSFSQINANDLSSDEVSEPRVIQLANGNVVIAYWTDSNVGVGSPTGYDIVAKIYDSQGNLIKDEFLLNTVSTNTNEFDFELTTSSDGSFTVAYQDAGLTTGSTHRLRLEHFQADGTQIESFSFTLDFDDAQGGTFNREPNITSISSSTILVTYEVYDTVNDVVDIRGRIYDANTDTSGGVFTIFNDFIFTRSPFEGIGGHSTTTLTTGEHVVVLANDNVGSNDQIVMRILNADGSSTGQLAQINVNNSFANAYDPHVVALSNGNFVVSWTADDLGGSNTGIRAQLYDSDGAALTATLTPATMLAGNQLYSSVGALNDGKFVVVWWDAEVLDIHGQVYNADGTTDGVEFNVVDYGPLTFNNVTDIDVEGFEDGRFQVTWALNRPVIDDEEIRSAIFDPRSSENSPNVYTTDQVVGTVDGDIIEIAAHDDQVYGWLGDDDFVFQPFEAGAGDIFDGGDGSDRLRIQGDGIVNFTSSTVKSFDQLMFQGDGNLNDKLVIFRAEQLGSGLSSTALVDGNIAGPDANDTLRFSMGSEKNLDLSGLTFVDWNSTDSVEVFGDGSNETITGSSQDDEIDGAGGKDVLQGKDGNDLITGGGNDDTIGGGKGNDTLRGNSGNDDLTGGDGDDNLNGGDGNDKLQGKDGADTLSGKDGEDTLIGGNGNDDLKGGANQDLLRGNGGNDDLSGGKGADTLFGNGGSDKLNGGKGNDDLTGGGNIDSFIFNNANWGDDTITDFDNGAEKMDMRGSGVTSGQLHVVNSGGDAIVDFGGASTITLLGEAGNINANDFIF